MNSGETVRRNPQSATGVLSTITLHERLDRVFQVQVHCAVTACLITRDSVARDSGVPHIEHIHNGYTSSISHGHSKAMDFPPCTRPVNFNLLVSNKLH